MRPNGPKIRTLRKRTGLTQRELAIRCAITARTLQRAEGGERVRPEILNSIAGGLKVSSSELCLESLSSVVGATQTGPNKELVRLARSATARQIVAALAEVQQLVFDYDIDPDEITAEEVAVATELIEQLSGEPNTRTSEPSTHVRQLGHLNKLLNRLETKGIRFFAGGYWEPTVIIEDDSAPDQIAQHCWVEMNYRGIMLISQSNKRYLTCPITRRYTEEQLDDKLEELKSFGWVVEDKRT